MLSPMKMSPWFFLLALTSSAVADAEPPTPPPAEQQISTNATATAEVPVPLKFLEKKPANIKKDMPSLPRELQAHGITAAVLSPHNWQHGSVCDIAVLYIDNPELAALALEAVKQWKFKPSRYQGKDVATRMQVAAFPFRK